MNEPLRNLQYFSSEVPEGKSGAWIVEKVTIQDRPYDPDADPRPDCFKFRPGRYTCLSRDSVQFMSDLFDEWWTQRSAVEQALTRGGNVLITGLGLGLVAEAILRADPHASLVGRITIVELSNDVIQLVGPYLSRRYPERIEIVHADAFEWEPPRGARFSVGWHDIWPSPFGVESEIERLERRYEAFCDWQSSWPRAYGEALISTASIPAAGVSNTREPS